MKQCLCKALENVILYNENNVLFNFKRANSRQIQACQVYYKCESARGMGPEIMSTRWSNRQRPLLIKYNIEIGGFLNQFSES